MSLCQTWLTEAIFHMENGSNADAKEQGVRVNGTWTESKEERHSGQRTKEKRRATHNKAEIRIRKARRREERKYEYGKYRISLMQFYR